MSYFQDFQDDDNIKMGGASSDEESISDNSDEDEIDDIEEKIVEEEEGVDDDIEDDDIEDDASIESTMEGGDADNVDDTENIEETDKKSKRVKKVPAKTVYKKPELDDDEEDDEEDEDGEMYLQKFDHSINDNYIVNFHPESVLQNYEEILSMVKVIRDKDDIIVDDLHKTIPFLTKYERARILGQRAKQINSGATPFVKVPENVIDGYRIAELELKEKRIPFIIRRPLPNGGSEYWKLTDLEDITF
jgi:DNA-directed RNA polymerase subunit K/omega